MYDVIIIGGGVAGLSAAINCAARNLNTAVFGNAPESSMIYKAEKVNNYLGMPDISGKEMLESFIEHAAKLGIKPEQGRVMQLLPMGSHFAVNFENDIYESKAVILALGVSKGKKIPGEEEFLGRGLSYCATCDGMLYRNKDVIVYSEIEEGIHDANFLAGICKSVSFIAKSGGAQGLDPRITVLEGIPAAIEGKDFAESLTIGETVYKCDGVFFIRETMSSAALVPGLAMDGNAIAVTRQMETNIKGLFACGDCTGAPYQISKAVGEGLVAAQQADKFIHK